MNFKKIILFIFFFSINFSRGQSGTPYFEKMESILHITEELIFEAEAKGVTSDSVIISFDTTSDCEVINFKISKPGILKNSNSEVEKQKTLIIKHLAKKINCEGGKVNHYVYPLRIII